MVKSPESRRNIYAYTLLGSVIAVAIVGLLNIWGAGLAETLSMKIGGSFIVVGGLATFLYTLTYNHDVKIVKRLGNLTGILAVALCGIILAQIWFEPFQEAFFGKISFTLVIIGLLAAFTIAVFDDFIENKRLKDENYLD